MKKMLCVCLLAACTGSSTQVVTGKVTSESAIAVRAVADSEIVTASRVRSDGSFTLSLPAGKQYRLEVMTSAGAVLPIGQKSAAVSFKVCQPQDPWDMGGVGSGSGGTTCQPPPPVACDPADPNCKLPPPPPPDPNCPPPPGCDPADPTTCKPSPPPPCDPATDANCPAPCDPASDPNGCKPPPPPCTDPNGCPPPPDCDPATDPSGCKPPPPPPCDPSTDPTCQLPPPPCADPNDPNTCKDPCMADPTQCACGPSADPATGSGSGTTGGGTCWPPPKPPGDCDGTMAPAHPPGDFGCGGSSGS